MKPLHALLSLAFASLATTSTAHAALVSTRADFQLLTLGPNAFGSLAATFGGIQVNGVNQSLCDTDASCGALFNGTSVFAAPLSGSAVTFGEWGSLGTDRNNAIGFAGAQVEVAGPGADNVFKLGTFSFTNGAFFDHSSFNFTLTTSSTDPALDRHSLSGRLVLDVFTANGIDPMEEADQFTLFDGAQAFQALAIYELGACPGVNPRAPGCNMGSVDVYGYVNSLHITGLRDATGGAVLVSVPEPQSFALTLAGLAALAATVRRRTVPREAA